MITTDVRAWQEQIYSLLKAQAIPTWVNATIGLG
jgi:hypothetical protein